MTLNTRKHWVIYSPNEFTTNGDRGFWSSEHGWVELGQATRFSAREACDVPLPIAAGHDARFVSLQKARQHHD